MTNDNAIGIHSGEHTHHHDHPITPVNFRTMNTTNNSPPRPIPLLLSITLSDWFHIILTTHPVVRLDVAAELGRYPPLEQPQHPSLNIHTRVVAVNNP